MVSMLLVCIKAMKWVYRVRFMEILWSIFSLISKYKGQCSTEHDIRLQCTLDHRLSSNYIILSHDQNFYVFPWKFFNIRDIWILHHKSRREVTLTDLFLEQYKRRIIFTKHNKIYSNENIIRFFSKLNLNDKN